MQDEVHRFAITFHKDKRSKGQTRSELDSIKGIGEKTKTLLLRHFKSVKRIKEAGFDELKAVVGEAKAKALREAFGEPVANKKRTKSEQKANKKNNKRTNCEQYENCYTTCAICFRHDRRTAEIPDRERILGAGGHRGPG